MCIRDSGNMTYAKGYYDSMYGRIESSWRVEDAVIYQCTVPANTTATLHLPATSVKNIVEGNRTLKKSKGIEYVGIEDGRLVLRLLAGRYSFGIK